MAVNSKEQGNKEYIIGQYKLNKESMKYVLDNVIGEAGLRNILKSNGGMVGNGFRVEKAPLAQLRKAVLGELGGGKYEKYSRDISDKLESVVKELADKLVNENGAKNRADVICASSFGADAELLFDLLDMRASFEENKLISDEERSEIAALAVDKIKQEKLLAENKHNNVGKDSSANLRLSSEESGMTIVKGKHVSEAVAELKMANEKLVSEKKALDRSNRKLSKDKELAESKLSKKEKEYSLLLDEIQRLKIENGELKVKSEQKVDDVEALEGQDHLEVGDAVRYPWQELCVCRLVEQEGRFTIKRLGRFDQDRVLMKEDMPEEIECPLPKCRTGLIGIWRWIDENPVESEYYKGEELVQVVLVHDRNIRDWKKLRAYLEKKKLILVEQQVVCQSFLLVFKSENTLSGILLSWDDVASQDGHELLLDLKRWEYRKCEITKDKLTELEDEGKKYYVLLKDEIRNSKAEYFNKIKNKAIKEAVKGAVAERHEYSLAELDKFYMWLDELNLREAAEKFAVQTKCDVTEAERLLAEFIAVKNKQLLSICEKTNARVKANKELLSGKDRLINERENIIEEKDRILKEKEKALLEIKNSIEAENKEYVQRVEELKAKYAALEEELKEKLNAFVNRAETDMAEVIFGQIQTRVTAVGILNAADQSGLRGEKQTAQYTHGRQPFSYKVSDVTGDEWTVFISCLANNLKTVGVEESFSTGLAAYLYYAYLVKLPIVLAGPGGKLIADALSVALSGKICGVLECDGNYSPSVVGEYLDSEDAVILVKNYFQGGWSERLYDKLSEGDKLLLLTVPYIEELKIEPESLLNYALPVLTDGFMRGARHGDFEHFCPSGDYKDYIPNEEFSLKNAINRKAMKAMGWRMMVYEKVGMVLEELDYIMDEMKEDDEDSALCKNYLVLLSCAYASDRMERLESFLKQSKQEEFCKEYIEAFK